MLQMKTLIKSVVILALLIAAGSAHAYKIPKAMTPSLIVMPDDGIKPILSIADSASRSLDIVAHRLEDQRIRDALKAAIKRGVTVRVMLEDRPEGLGETREQVERKVREAGAFIQWANPKFKTTRQDTLIVDSKAAYISTFAFTEEAIDGSRGFIVKTVDPREVSEIARMFEADWTRARSAPASSRLAWSPDVYRTKAFRLISAALHTLHIYAEEIGDENMVRTIARAIERGVMTRILVSADGAKASGPGMLELMKAGAIVRTMKQPMLMANVILADAGKADQEALIGSIDLTEAAMDGSRGLAAVVSDKESLSRVESTFMSDYARAK